MDKDNSNFDTEQEWKWCLVGNIVGEHEYGEEHVKKFGTKHFRPNTKVYVYLAYQGMGNEIIDVIGLPRKSSKYIEVSIARKYVCNFRVQKVFKSAILKKMRESDFNWWKSMDDEEYEKLVACLEWLNEEV